MKRLRSSLAISLLFLIVVSYHTTVFAKDTWISLRTKNFLIVGNGSAKDVRQVGLRLEQFREVFTYLFPNIKFNTPVPTTVVVFKSDSSYKPFRLGPNNAGYFQGGLDVNYIALDTEAKGQQDPFSIIFHEYTHLLVRNTFNNPPVWFNEGLAEYYRTFSIANDQKIVLGTPIASHVFLLREKQMLPLRMLFEVDYKSPHYNEANKQGIFYAQSWALMHYLILGRPGKTDQLGKFTQLLSFKVPMEKAFEQAFGMPFEAMEKELRNYVRQDRYNVVQATFKRKLELDTAAEVKTLSEAEAQAYLGDLMLHSHRRDAYIYLENALKLDPNLAMAHASLGMAYFREGRISEARASLERAIAANSQNYLAHYYYAYALSRSTADEGLTMSSGYAPEIAEKMRQHLQKAIELRPDFPEPYNLLAYVSLVTGKNVDESIASLKRVLTSSPGLHDITYMLGQLYFRKDDYKTAREMLEQVAKSDADEHVRSHSESLLTQIRLLEQQRSAPAILGTYNQDSGQTGQAAPPNDPSFYLREALKKPGPGETRLQASLLKIDCAPKEIVFVVRTTAGVLRLKTVSFDAIQMTTHDPEMNGEISCGPRNPENVVVVSYIPNTDKRIKADGLLKSIEFVPKDFKLNP